MSAVPMFDGEPLLSNAVIWKWDAKHMTWSAELRDGVRIAARYRRIGTYGRSSYWQAVAERVWTVPDHVSHSHGERCATANEAKRSALQYATQLRQLEADRSAPTTIPGGRSRVDGEVG